MLDSVRGFYRSDSSWSLHFFLAIDYCRHPEFIFRSDAQETYVYSHFAWQIRTFWFAFLFVVLVLLIGGILLFLGIGLVIYWVGFFILGIWVAYRIIYGWMKLNNRVPLEL